jgi:hypothetical protein
MIFFNEFSVEFDLLLLFPFNEKIFQGYVTGVSKSI